MEKITSLPSVAIMPTSIEDNGELLVKQQQLSYGATATKINKLIKDTKSNSDAVAAQITALQNATHTVNDMTDVTITSPTEGQLLTYKSGEWKNSSRISTVSFNFVYPTTNQYSPFYKFKSNKKIININISAIIAPSSAMTFRLYRSDGWLPFEVNFTGQDSNWNVDINVTEGELWYAFIPGATNGINLVNFELTVVDR